MKKFLFALLLATSVAFAAPPYDVELTVVAPPDGGPVDSYEFFVDDVSQGTVLVGTNSFPDLITSDGTYTFRVDATNAKGTTLGVPVTKTIAELLAPGQTTIQIQFGCADGCIVTE